jgi:glycine cleavage system H protein
MSAPTDRRYSTTHEWCKLEGDKAVMGLTQFAVDQLTDITFIELPAPGTKVKAGQPMGQVESVKAANDIFSPISGEVLEINQQVVERPSILNSDAHEAGWLVKIKPSNKTEMDALLDPAAYDELAREH